MKFGKTGNTDNTERTPPKQCSKPRKRNTKNPGMEDPTQERKGNSYIDAVEIYKRRTLQTGQEACNPGSSR